MISEEHHVPHLYNYKHRKTLNFQIVRAKLLRPLNSYLARNSYASIRESSNNAGSNYVHNRLNASISCNDNSFHLNSLL